MGLYDRPRVFLSYAVRGTPWRSLVEVVACFSGSATVFIDRPKVRSIYGQQRVVRELHRSDLFLKLDSAEARRSPWVKLESSMAHICRKSMVVVDCGRVVGCSLGLEGVSEFRRCIRQVESMVMESCARKDPTVLTGI